MVLLPASVNPYHVFRGFRMAARKSAWPASTAISTISPWLVMFGRGVRIWKGSPVGSVLWCIAGGVLRRRSVDAGLCAAFCDQAFAGAWSRRAVGRWPRQAQGAQEVNELASMPAAHQELAVACELVVDMETVGTAAYRARTLVLVTVVFQVPVAVMTSFGVIRGGSRCSRAAGVGGAMRGSRPARA